MADQTKYTQKLKGDKVLVIGGSGGIGFAAAEACIEYGCTVIISGSSQTRADETVSKLQASYPSAKDRISGHPCNLSDENQLEENIKTLFDQAGTGLDHVLYLSGDALAMMPLDTITMQNVKQAGMVRYFAPLFVGKHAPKYLNPGPKSSITLTTGAVSERPTKDWTVIGGYGAGLHGLTRGLALDLQPIRVNLVSPGVVDTGLWRMSEEEKLAMFAEMKKKIPVQEVGQAHDIAEAYLYLMKDHNITGTVISTSGGTLLVG